MVCCDEDRLPDVVVGGQRIEVWRGGLEGTAFIWRLKKGDRELAVVATAVKVTVGGDMHVYHGSLEQVEKLETAIRQAMEVFIQLSKDPARESLEVDGAIVYPYAKVQV